MFDKVRFKVRRTHLKRQNSSFMFSKLAQFCCLVLVLILSLTTFSQVNPTLGEERMKAVQQRKLLEQNSLVNNIKFRNIGPVTMSGRAVDIEANPDDPTEFYVA